MDKFADLRMHVQAAQAGDDGFWPSFTDIMMVVVMIFLITTSVLIIQNWELLREITVTADAQRRAAELAYTKGLENSTLEEQLSQAQHLLSMLRMEQLNDREKNSKLTQKLLSAQIKQGETERQRLALELKQQDSAITLQQQLLALAQLQQQLSDNQTKLETSSANVQSAQQRIAQLEQRDSQKASELASAHSQSLITQQKLDQLELRYQQIISKYNKLVGPARSPKGRVIVALRHSISNGIGSYELKSPGAEKYQSHSLEQLHLELKQLQQQHDNNLYIKIIFPENNGLSYKQAWEFTSSILEAYDYYHQ